MRHIHITSLEFPHGDHRGEYQNIATISVDDAGHVTDDGSIAAHNAIHHVPHGKTVDDGPELLDAIVKHLDRSSYVGAYHCYDDHPAPPPKPGTP